MGYTIGVSGSELIEVINKLIDSGEDFDITINIRTAHDKTARKPIAILDMGLININNDNISTVLRSIGIAEDILGFRYIKYAVELGLKDAKILDEMTGRLYPTVAKKFETKPSRAERAIRHAIQSAFSKSRCEENRNILFGHLISVDNYYPTNKQFLVTLINLLKEQGGC